MQATKLSTGNVLVRDGSGWARIIVPPCGICYREDVKCWNVKVIRGDGDWTTVPINITKNRDPLTAFKEAVRLRDASIHCILNRRLLPRIRMGYKVLTRGDMYAVRNPFTQTYETFRTLDDAKAYNQSVVEEYIKKYTTTMDRMVTIAKVK